MGILRLFSLTMARISTFRPHQLALLLAAALAVMAFYYFGSEKQNFSSTTKRIKETQESHNSNRNDADLSANTRAAHHDENRAKRQQTYHALMMFTKINMSRSMQSKFEVAMRSMAKHGRFREDELLVLHYVSDGGSKELAMRMLPELLHDATFQYEVITLTLTRWISLKISSLVLWFLTPHIIGRGLVINSGELLLVLVSVLAYRLKIFDQYHLRPCVSCARILYKMLAPKSISVNSREISNKVRKILQLSD